MNKRTLALSIAAVAVVSGIAFAQQTMEGMDHSNIYGRLPRGKDDVGSIGFWMRQSMRPVDGAVRAPGHDEDPLLFAS